MVTLPGECVKETWLCNYSGMIVSSSNRTISTIAMATWHQAGKQREITGVISAQKRSECDISHLQSRLHFYVVVGSKLKMFQKIQPKRWDFAVSAFRDWFWTLRSTSLRLRGIGWGKGRDFHQVIMGEGSIKSAVGVELLMDDHDRETHLTCRKFIWIYMVMLWTHSFI